MQFVSGCCHVFVGPPLSPWRIKILDGQSLSHRYESQTLVWIYTSARNILACARLIAVRGVN